MKKTKRFFAGLLIPVMLMLMMPALGGAATETILNPVTFNKDVVTVSGVVPTPKSRVYIEIVRKDAEILDKENVYFSKIITAGEEGEFSLNCKMPEKDKTDSEKLIDGYFTLYVITTGTKDATADFAYVMPGSLEQFFIDINKALGSGLKSFLKDRNNKIYFDLYNIPIDEFYEISNNSDTKTDILCEVLNEKVKSFTDSNMSEINDAIITSRLNSLSDTAAVKAVIESEYIFSRCDLKYNDGNEEKNYDNLDSEEKEWFYEVVLTYSKQNKFTAISQLNDVFAAAVALNKINKTHYSSLFDVLKNNADALELADNDTYKAVSALTSENAQVVMQNLKELSDRITTNEDLATLLKSAYDSYTAGLTQQGTENGNYSSVSTSTGGSSKKNSNSALTAGAIPQNNSTVGTSGKTDGETTNYFNDLGQYEWAKEAVNKLAEDKIVSGDGQGNFNPEQNVTRAEFVTMLMEAIDMVSDSAVCEFDDVPKDSWCYKYVASAFEEGIASGVSEREFGKDNPVTRQEAAVFLHRAAVRVYLPMDNAQEDKFADESEIAQWALRSVNIMKAAGLINGVGDGRFDPHGVTTRAQAAKMIFGLYELI